MSDTSWMNAREKWERLRWARLYWQRKNGSAETIRAAAESLGENENTYAAYERAPDSSKHTALDDQRAIQFGNKFKVNWAWILSGEGTPFDRTPAQERAVQALAQVPEDQQEEFADMIEAVIRRRIS